MNRAIASFLLAVISLPLIAAVVWTDRFSSRPACCRRDGKHHCEMAGMHSSDDNPVVVASKCQSWPRPAVAALHLHAPPSAGAETDSLLPSYTVFFRSQQRRFCAAKGSTKKRGPPFLLG